MSDALSRLRQLLRTGTDQSLSRSLATGVRELDAQTARLQRRLASAGRAVVRQDISEAAVRRFCSDGRLASFRDAYLVSHGILLPIGREHARLIQDPGRFPVLLAGVDHYLGAPRRFRRCYQGLLRGYFGYDREGESQPAFGRQNWARLRGYLDERSGRILSERGNPRWADCLQNHRNLFGEDPCARYGPQLLSGHRQEVDELRTELGIPDSSWFMRELYLAQVRTILDKPDAQYLELLPRLVELLSDNTLIADAGLALTLDHHASLKQPPVSTSLREFTVQRWGNPWLPGNSARWIRVGQPARAMVTEWLKLAFVRDFFMLLAEDGQGDTRRLEFWQRYVPAIGEIHFALGTEARTTSSRDFVAMRKRMEGLILPLHDPNGKNNAFIMRMGPLVVVEFSGFSNALYGYKASNTLPFSLDPAKSLTIRVDAPNSLKQSRRAIHLVHQDDVRGFDRWEHRFKAELAEYGIHQDDAIQPEWNARSSRRSPPVRRVGAPPTPIPEVGQLVHAPNQEHYSPRRLAEFAERAGVEIVDLTQKGGALWVRADDSNAEIYNTLRGWGFKYKDTHKGWWLIPS